MLRGLSVASRLTPVLEEAAVTRGEPGDAEEGLRVHDLDGELTIYDPLTNQALVLNETATRAWLLADGTLFESQIVRILAEDHGVAGASIEVEVHRLFDELADLGVLEQRDPPSHRP